MCECVCVCLYIYIYIYIQRERERERESDTYKHMHTYIYIYIYKFIQLQPEKKTAVLATNPLSDDASEIRHGSWTKATLSLTQGISGVPHNTTRLYWFYITIPGLKDLWWYNFLNILKYLFVLLVNLVRYEEDVELTRKPQHFTSTGNIWLF